LLLCHNDAKITKVCIKMITPVPLHH
jgi:hypothetical protein